MGLIYDLFNQGKLVEENLKKYTLGDPSSYSNAYTAYTAKFSLEFITPITWFEWCYMFQ